MEHAIPVAVQFLNKENAELCRSMSSYLSLAAIDNVTLVSNHTDQIVESIISGKKS